ncbi:MAG TPA: polymorphic toxin-type HINT domain-containing protein, partial [Polyangia bacterium]
MQPRSHAARLLRDVRGGTIELIIIVGLFVFGIVVGVRHLASGTNVALQCHGARIQNPDGSFSCGGGGALPNGSTATGSNPQTPAPCRGGFCMCFVAGTPVLTATGLQAIETIAPGTLVFTRGQEGEPPVLRPVVRTFVNRARALVKLTVTTNAGFSETFSTTANHPFYVAGRGWIEAGDLDPGADALLDHAGRPLAITEAETTPGRVLVYNLEVGEHHTYFVGATGVWVHHVTLSEIMNGGRPTLVRVGQWQYRDPVGRVRPIKILDQTGTVIGRTNAQVLRLN